MSRGQSVETDNLDEIIKLDSFPAEGLASGHEDVIEYKEETGFEDEEHI